MILFDTIPTSCLNWKLISKEKFPKEYTDSNVEENFNLLFQENIDAIKLKEILRNSFRDPNQAVRKFLWKRILLHDADRTTLAIDKYKQKIATVFGKNLNLKAELPDFVDQDHLVYYYLNEEGKEAVVRILNILASVHPDITFSPLLLPLASLFLHYMTEPECYCCLLLVVESKNKITETDIHWITTNHVFRRFAHKYAQGAYDYLLESLLNNTDNPEICFDVIDNWLWWIFEYLPFNFVLNIVDSFLLEGTKVLYRFGISILEHFYKSILQSSKPVILKENCMKEYCNNIELSYDKLIKTAFGYRNMSRKDIDQAFQSEEKSIKKLRSKANEQPSKLLTSGIINKMKRDDQLVYSSKRSNSISSAIIDQPVVQTAKKKIYTTVMNSLLRFDDSSSNSTPTHIETSQQVAVSSSRPSLTWTTPFLKTLRSQKNKKWYLLRSNSSNHSLYHHHHHHLQASMPSFSVENIGSSILTPEQITIIWRWMPSRYQILDMQMVYSTNIHGCRLMTLFDKIEFYPATILVIQTTTNSIFGAFCSQPWSNRLHNTKTSLMPSFFGNGETFLFELVPNVKKYEWVGKDLQDKTESYQELFMFADKNKMVVGGAGKKGVGLMIDSDLIYGHSSQSDTFDNDILGTQCDFEISVLEVFSFNANES
jgi:hypothetical protein